MLQKEFQSTLKEAQPLPELGEIALTFEKYVQEFASGTAHLLFKRNQGPDYFLADATLFLEGAGLLCMGWIWLKQAITAQKAINQGSNEQNFHLVKIETARYTVAYELTKLNGILERFASTQYPTLDMKTDWF